MTRAKGGRIAVGAGFANDDFFGGEGSAGREAAALFNTAQLGLWALLATLSMLFAGFTSAYLVRRAGSDWQPVSMPTVLWFNTALLLLSSITIEAARASLRRWRMDVVKRWLLATITLGLAFLVGQLFGWQQLRAQGVYLPTSPHSSFFYVLTGVHAAHVLGGLLALLYAFRCSWHARWSATEPTVFNLCASYWHFVGGLWLYLFLLLFVW